MQTIRFNDRDNSVFEKTIAVLKNGGLVVFPSDTVYGLLVDAENEKAVRKLIQFKNRPPGKPISVFVADFNMMKSSVEVTSNQLSLLKEFIPGPFTVILPSKHTVCKQLESENGTLGVRLPDYGFIQTLVKKFTKPVTATSANLSGRSPHYSTTSLLKDIPKNKISLIDLIIDAGTLPKNKPSTVIDLTSSTIKTVRRGDIVFDKAQSFLSKSESQTRKIGRYIINKNMHEIDKKPLALIIKGELGVGKTVLIKGVGEMLGIGDIVSPTFVVYYEYKAKHKLIHFLYHFDLFQLKDAEEFSHLGIKSLLTPNNILCFEWGEKTGEIIKILEEKSKIIYIEMNYINKREREIKIKS